MKNSIAISCAFLLCAQAANAATLVVEDDTLDGNEVSVAQFDPSLGSLISVDYIFLAGGFSSVFETFAEGEYVGLDIGAAGQIEFLGDIASDGGFGQVDEGICTEVAGCDAFAEAFFSVGLSGFKEAGFDDLSPFIGLGSLIGTFTTDADMKSVDLRVEYTFTPTPVPLPASLPLLLAGLGGLGLAARRKRVTR